MKALDLTVYALLILLTVSFMLWVKPTAHPSPSGLLLPLNPSMAPSNPRNIQLYQRPPQGAHPLGFVFAQYHQPLNAPGATDTLTKYAEDLAAKAGADGMIINSIGYAGRPEYPMLSGYEIIGTAIKLDKKP